jgi:hypothetical protein
MNHESYGMDLTDHIIKGSFEPIPVAPVFAAGGGTANMQPPPNGWLSMQTTNTPHWGLNYVFSPSTTATLENGLFANYTLNFRMLVEFKTNA